jgi:hypothetical protein
MTRAVDILHDLRCRNDVSVQADSTYAVVGQLVPRVAPSVNAPNHQVDFDIGRGINLSRVVAQVIAVAWHQVDCVLSRLVRGPSGILP